MMEKIMVPIPSSNSSNQPAPQDQSPDSSQVEVCLNPSDTESNSIYGGVGVGIQPIESVQAKPQNPAANPGHWSTSLQTLLDQPPSSLPQRLIVSGMIFCVAFGAWATFGTIDEVGYAHGRLVPQGDVYKIHPVASGKVAHIHIEEGETVKTGQVLVEFDHEIAKNEVERLQQQYSASQTELAQIQTLIENTRLEAETRVAIGEAQAKGQEAAIAQAKAQAQAQEVAIHQNKAHAANQQELLNELKEDMTAHEARLQQLKPLLEDGAIAAEVVFQREQTLRDRQRTITQTQGELQHTLVESERLQAERRQALAESERVQAELTQRQAEVRTTQIEAQQKIQQLEVQKTQLQAKLTETENRLTQANTQLKELSLKTPIHGVVFALNIANIGEVVQPGQTLAEIAPQDAPLVLSANLPSQNAGFVQTGMPVQVKMDAYPFQDYGIIPGKISSISPDTRPDERFGAVYHVEVTLDRNSITANDQTIQFKAGETATAEIIIRRRRIADIVLDPIRKLQKGGINL